jgi:uncharacterized membrane protein
MNQDRQAWTDEQLERVMGNLLRAGVLLAAAVVLVGGIMYLAQRGREPADYREFHGVPEELRSPIGIMREASHLQSRGLIQLGLLLLVATPVARVAFTIYAFLRQHDYTYVVVALIVLGILLYGLLVEQA